MVFFPAGRNGAGGDSGIQDISPASQAEKYNFFLAPRAEISSHKNNKFVKT
jgi:hypothetical protein